ncbi:MAG TPA: bifunctional (p)ppGpp synthetase/guanosine-3',5'-bis(diphosphate) 3'-pyrophosphohydrolase, partial [Steroidobacteraceae bacterium]|nr:bifunctional (p)ppGpp synthetase/guanosine-3',5'-bis(diphosphate) 3'-pyrophosphohydrolase [Steroidobacteraceae bacterium]
MVSDVSLPPVASERQLVRGREFVGALSARQCPPEVREHALALDEILATLGLDAEVLLGAMLYPLLQAGAIDGATADEVFGVGAHRIAEGVLQLGIVDSLPARQGGEGLAPGQAEALRKMLLAVVADLRLVLIRLAEQLWRLRNAKSLDEPARRQLALETRDVHAPLANRLGIWQLKWELEDLSFRYLEPEDYKRIATWLATKRGDREAYITQVVESIRRALAEAGIEADIAGRPKHIYSIWRKMQRKSLPFEQLYDVRAVRVIVASIADCYAALGIVHGLWPYFPGEFDDYLANPKDNLYRSLHTAVIGPQKLPLEIQIRTREMHDHAELGVAAHWRYKEGGRGDPAYERKINWLRQVLEPSEREESDSDFLERIRAEVFEDRVYALSPRGEIVDLPRGATPLDFAYHVHTELGHRCRGAKVNGRMVPLDQPLANGDQVEIVTGKQPNPSRDWLVPSLGYLVSPRNRAKVRAWFRKLDESQNRIQGKQILERELQRLAIHSVTLPELLAELGQATADELYLAIGEGEVTPAQVAGAVLRRARPQELPRPVTRRPVDTGAPTDSVRVDGVDALLSNFARCCRPVPPEPIAGYITLGRGVSIHRESCSNLAR